MVVPEKIDAYMTLIIKEVCNWWAVPESEIKNQRFIKMAVFWAQYRLLEHIFPGQTSKYYFYHISAKSGEDLTYNSYLSRLYSCQLKGSRSPQFSKGVAVVLEKTLKELENE